MERIQPAATKPLGAAIVAVASLSEDPTIRIYNKKRTYNKWQFIYNPVTDQPNVLLRGPYQPTIIGGAQAVVTADDASAWFSHCGYAIQLFSSKLAFVI